MKIVVDISEDTRKRCRKICLNPVDFAIRDGKPLDDVLDEIKAEITRRHLSINEKSEFDNGRTYAYEEVIDVINKYKEGVNK